MERKWFDSPFHFVSLPFRNRLKVIESSYQQQVARLQDENGDLSEQHVAWQQCQDRERSEQVARYQRKLNEFEEEKAKEKERLRELQRWEEAIWYGQALPKTLLI